MKALKALWKLVGDDRLGLIIAGLIFAIACTEFKSGEYASGVIDLAFSLLIGGLSWRDLGPAVRS